MTLNRNISATESLAEKKCRETAIEAGQGHIFRWWNEITHGEKQHLLDQITSIDFPLMKKIFTDTRLKPAQSIRNNFSPPRIIPIPTSTDEQENALKAKHVGESSLKRGEMSVLTVAGGREPDWGAMDQKAHSLLARLAARVFSNYMQKRYRRSRRGTAQLFPGIL